MVIGRIVGYSQKFQYTSKNTGECYSAINVFVEYSDPSVVGKKCASGFFRVKEDDKLLSFNWLELDKKVIISFGNKGSVSGVLPTDMIA